MPEPRGHLAKGHQLRRRSHMALKASSLTACTNCKKAKRPHAVCSHCGSYKGKTVIDIVGKELAKQEKRKKRTQT